MTPRLLVSVRSVTEALDALAGGADLIDVKEPAQGSLGRASNTTITAIVEAVAGRAPVSAALGEWAERTPHELPAGLTWGKWGLAGVRDPRTLHAVRQSLLGVHPVLVAYADAERANSFRPSEMAEWAIDLGFDVLLIDTYIKDGTTLLDWLNPTTFAPFAHRLRQANVQLALAGSLHAQHIEFLRPLQPTWFAVRGAACHARQRTGSICRERVRELKAILQAPLENPP